MLCVLCVVCCREVSQWRDCLPPSHPSQPPRQNKPSVQSLWHHPPARLWLDAHPHPPHPLPLGSREAAVAKAVEEGFGGGCELSCI